MVGESGSSGIEVGMGDRDSAQEVRWERNRKKMKYLLLKGHRGLAGIHMGDVDSRGGGSGMEKEENREDAGREGEGEGKEGSGDVAAQIFARNWHLAELRAHVSQQALSIYIAMSNEQRKQEKEEKGEVGEN